LLVFVPFVSAQYFGGYWYGTEQVINSIVQTLEPLLRALLGGYDWTGYLLFEKTLLFILISIIVGLVLTKIPVFENIKNKKILRLIAVIVGLLAVRNLNYIWINTIVVQYQALFIAIAGILPFIIYWYFVKDLQSAARKVAWVFYAVIYFGLWATTTLETYSEVYLWAAIASLIYAFVFDTMVVQWLRTQEMKKHFSRHAWNQIAEINERISKLNKQIAEGLHPNNRSAQQEIAELIRHRSTLARGREII
jgi:hypothetical protein